MVRSTFDICCCHNNRLLCLQFSLTFCVCVLDLWNVCVRPTCFDVWSEFSLIFVLNWQVEPISDIYGNWLRKCWIALVIMSILVGLQLYWICWQIQVFQFFPTKACWGCLRLSFNIFPCSLNVNYQQSQNLFVVSIEKNCWKWQIWNDRLKPFSYSVTL